MADSFDVLVSEVPTAIRSFTVTVAAVSGTPNVISRTFSAAVEDQDGKQRFTVSGDLEDFVEPAVYDGLESFIAGLYVKASNEMIP